MNEGFVRNKVEEMKRTRRAGDMILHVIVLQSILTDNTLHFPQNFIIQMSSARAFTGKSLCHII